MTLFVSMEQSLVFLIDTPFLIEYVLFQLCPHRSSTVLIFFHIGNQQLNPSCISPQRLLLYMYISIILVYLLSFLMTLGQLVCKTSPCFIHRQSGPVRYSPLCELVYSQNQHRHRLQSQLFKQYPIHK